jgi:hypothetical protein
MAAMTDLIGWTVAVWVQTAIASDRLALLLVMRRSLDRSAKHFCRGFKP